MMTAKLTILPNLSQLIIIIYYETRTLVQKAHMQMYTSDYKRYLNSWHMIIN